MKCDHPRCTGSHDTRKRDRMCPRTRADEIDSVKRYRGTAKGMLMVARQGASHRGRRRDAAAF